MRRITFSLALFGLIVCVVLLLNITAPNPTGRRYSSEIPLTQGSARAIGESGERVLANDLRLPNNNASDQRKCICKNSNSPSTCNICIVHTSAISASTHRIPDFVSSALIADSKNTRILRDYDQLNDMALAALQLKIPFWIFVRVDTEVAPEYIALTEATGGGVVRYFAVDDYTDPVDVAARIGSVVALIVIVLVTILSWRTRRQNRGVTLSDNPLKPYFRISKSKADKAIENAEDFKHRTVDRLKLKIDIEDSPRHKK